MKFAYSANQDTSQLMTTSFVFPQLMDALIMINPITSALITSAAIARLTTFLTMIALFALNSAHPDNHCAPKQIRVLMFQSAASSVTFAETVSA